MSEDDGSTVIFVNLPKVTVSVVVLYTLVVPDTLLKNTSVAVMSTLPVIVPAVTRPRETVVASEGSEGFDKLQVSVGDDIRLCVYVMPDDKYVAIASNG